MKGLIHSNGCLSIERNGTIKLQYCPFLPGIFCSDRCPHFGEPFPAPEPEMHQAIYLSLTCGHERLLVFDDFTDERINPDAADKII